MKPVTFNKYDGHSNVLRDPEWLARRWDIREAAYLTDLARGGWGCEVMAVDDDDKSTILTMSTSDDYRATSRREGVFTSINWRIDQVIGNSPYLHKLSRAVINVIGIPIPETPTYGSTSRDGIRPYKDMLFLDGPMNVTIPENDAQNLRGATLNIGDVIGLQIVTTEGIVPVWEPEI